jgi:hypothetical protein
MQTIAQLGWLSTERNQKNVIAPKWCRQLPVEIDPTRA